ncbi:aldo/keto reductase [Siphonobacter curvatus]|uniref:Aldo/keto reductase n=1 Tax=Siphonobacter curvatus TaxID=2094562 RepID=A0A2S7IQY0_9BACT|nr:aldo/keto reductase [Siphonobacter curvatus]PQA60121.1 aldo/keto reductase [Siphonobacter curvatus]
MEYTELGSSGVFVSALTYGAFAIGGTMWGGNAKKDSIAAIHASLDEGVTSIDTAPFYGLGRSEEMIGEAIKGKNRDQIQILTKFGLVWDQSNQGRGEYFFDAEEQGNTVPVYKYTARTAIIKELEESLHRLGTDYIDLLQVHWPDATTPIDETMEALATLLQQGKIRAAGVCNYSLDQLKEAERTLSLASEQVSYSMLNRSIEADIVPYTQKKNLSIIAYSPLERGLLTGKYFKDSQLKADDHRNGYFGQFPAEKIKTFLAAITPLAEAKGATVSQLVLRWTTLQPGISVVLAGARNATQAIENAQAMHVDIRAEEMTFINQQLETVYA